MKRGRPFEMALAVIGTVAWGLVALVSASQNARGGVAIGGGLLVLSIVEIVRWQRGQPAMGISSRLRAGRGAAAVPTTAWFGLGGLGAELVLGLVWGLSHPSTTAMPSLLPIAVYLVAGGLASFVLSKNFDRWVGSLARAPGRPEVPPPPAPSAASIDAHNAVPVHELGGPTATLYHLRLEHGVELDPFSSSETINATHAGLHAQAPIG